jgi:hypothetical protein
LSNQLPKAPRENGDWLINKPRLRIIIWACFFLGLALTSPLLIRCAFFGMPEYSSTFRCPEDTLLMVDRLNSIGIKATPVIGNLDLKGEEYSQCDHLWVLADISGLQIPLDWGYICPDRQHYEGFTVTRLQLTEFVARDSIRIKNTGNLE